MWRSLSKLVSIAAMSESPVNHADGKALMEKLLFSADRVLPPCSEERMREGWIVALM